MRGFVPPAASRSDLSKIYRWPPVHLARRSDSRNIASTHIRSASGTCVRICIDANTDRIHPPQVSTSILPQDGRKVGDQYTQREHSRERA